MPDEVQWWFPLGFVEDKLLNIPEFFPSKIQGMTGEVMTTSRHSDSNHSHIKEIHVFVGLYAGENTTSVGFIKLPLPKQAMGWISMYDNKFVKAEPPSVCYLLLLGTNH